MFELKERCFEVFVILNRNGVHPEGSRHLRRITHRASATFLTPLLIPVEAFSFFGTIGKEKNIGFFYFPERFQDRKKVVCSLGIESEWNKIDLLDGFLNRPDEMIFANPGNLRFSPGKKGGDQLVDAGKGCP